eukprot:5656617-Alexandrium_andersonii.AAC.1
MERDSWTGLASLYRFRSAATPARRPETRSESVPSERSAAWSAAWWAIIRLLMSAISILAC